MANGTSVAEPPGVSTVVPTRNSGWIVTFAGVGINLALGVLYAWSVITKKLPAEWGWSEADKSWPYSVACLVFALVMVPAGRMQDRIGPRVVASIGGVLVGIGMIIASQTTSPMGYILGFGILAGAGIGFGYAAATPAAVKWFPAAKTGMIAGIVVAGFGLANVYVAPTVETLIGARGVPTTMMALGIGFLIVVVALSQLLRVPPAGYVPAGTPAAGSAAAVKRADYAPAQILGTWQFYVLWFMYFCGAGAGLMIVSKLSKLVEVQADLKLGFLLVAVLGVGNGGGRVIAGVMSDRIGRKATLLICFLFQAILMVLLAQATRGSALATAPVLALMSALIGANYGANLAVFPSVTKDYFGLRNFGVNYGLVFTAWGVGGFVTSQLVGRIFDKTHAFTQALYIAAVFLVVAAVVTLFVKPPRSPAEAVVAG